MGSKQVEFRDNSEEIVEALNRAKHIALEAIGMAAERYAKKDCPVDTGRLRNSITYAIAGYPTHVKSYRKKNVEGGTDKKHERYEYIGESMEGEKDSAVFIGSNVEYAQFVENGAQGRTAVHFLKRAATEHSDEYKKLMENSIKNA